LDPAISTSTNRFTCGTFAFRHLMALVFTFVLLL